MEVNLPGKGIDEEIARVAKKGEQSVFGAACERGKTAEGVVIAGWVEAEAALQVGAVK